MVESLQVTVDDIYKLAGAQWPDAVLYVNTDGDEPKLDVWTGSYVDDRWVVATRETVIDLWGDPEDGSVDVEQDSVTELLQADADRIFEELARFEELEAEDDDQD